MSDERVHRLYVKVTLETFSELCAAAVDADEGTREFVGHLLERWAKRRRRLLTQMRAEATRLDLRDLGVTGA